MKCRNCGHENPEGSERCRSCGMGMTSWGSPPPPPPPADPPAPPPPAPPGIPATASPAGEKIDNHLLPAILATLCCCLPAGIVAIIYAAQVNTKLGAGDLAGARAASDQARTWSWISFGAGLAVGLLAIFVELSNAAI